MPSGPSESGMRVRALNKEVEVWTPAKLNLFLEVLSKRTDGFHEVETLMVPISLYDTLYFKEEPTGRLELSCAWAWRPKDAAENALPLPGGDANIVVRAVRLLQQRMNVGRGAELRLVKRIPMAAGLAGGSSDAAAALVAANRAWQLGLSHSELTSLAAEVGSDVPFFLQGGPAVCRGRGERIEPLPNRGTWHFVVVGPPEGLGTADVYRACLPADRPRTADELAAALRAGRLDHAGRLLHNGLQEAAAGLSPWVPRMEREFARIDIVGARMSGSGTSWFGLCHNARHAQRVARTLRMRGLGQVFAVRSGS
jgi:4-diphosphocytidyl-2-C-methyl-D-erythritol kinase